ncbi:MAG: hypothetical protein HKN89_07460 [Eudoraea sp.]|nr:hypothetical protein [Eudoraea sp.]
MKWIVYLFGILMIIASIFLLVDENIILDYINSNKESSWLYFFAVVIRLVLGVALLRTATASKFPLVFKIIGYIALAAAIIFLLIGHEQFQHVLGSLLPYFENTGRWVSIPVLAFGAFIIYALRK